MMVDPQGVSHFSSSDSTGGPSTPMHNVSSHKQTVAPAEMLTDGQTVYNLYRGVICSVCGDERDSETVVRVWIDVSHMELCVAKLDSSFIARYSLPDLNLAMGPSVSGSVVGSSLGMLAAGSGPCSGGSSMLVEDLDDYERGNYSPADHSYVQLCKREAPTQCRFVASPRPSRRLLVTSHRDVSWEGRRPYYSSVAPEKGGLAGHVLGGGSLGECVPGRELCSCIVCGGACCLA